MQGAFEDAAFRQKGGLGLLGDLFQRLTSATVGATVRLISSSSTSMAADSAGFSAVLSASRLLPPLPMPNIS